MTRFRYTARDSQDRPVDGQVEGVSLDQVRADLETTGLVVVSLRAVEGRSDLKLTAAESSRISEHVASLLAAGVPIATGLRAVADEIGSEQSLLQRLNPLAGLSRRRLRRALVRIAKRLERGDDLTEVLAQLQVAGEVGAVLGCGMAPDATSEAIGEYSAQVSSLALVRGQVIFLLLYPLVVSAALLSFLAAFFYWVVPIVGQIVEEMGTETPAITKLMLSVSELVLMVDPLIVLPFPLLITILIGLWLCFGGRSVGIVLSYVPFVGSAFRSVSLARFSHILAVAIRHEAPLPSAIDAAGQATGDSEIRRASRELAETVRHGEPLPATDAALAGFPLSFVQILQDGSDRATVADALQSIARSFENRGRDLVTLLAAFVNPLVILNVALVVILCVLGVIMPMYQLLRLF